MRRPKPSPRGLAIAIALARCPDCNSVTSGPTRDALGIWHLAVSHDDTCPRWRRIQALSADRDRGTR